VFEGADSSCVLQVHGAVRRLIRIEGGDARIKEGLRTEIARLARLYLAYNQSEMVIDTENYSLRSFIKGWSNFEAHLAMLSVAFADYERQ